MLNHNQILTNPAAKQAAAPIVPEHPQTEATSDPLSSLAQAALEVGLAIEKAR